MGDITYQDLVNTYKECMSSRSYPEEIITTMKIVVKLYGQEEVDRMIREGFITQIIEENVPPPNNRP